MGWLELRMWRRELVRTMTARRRLTRTDPESWAGRQTDGWWAEQREMRDRLRGR